MESFVHFIMLFVSSESDRISWWHNLVGLTVSTAQLERYATKFAPVHKSNLWKTSE